MPILRKKAKPERIEKIYLIASGGMGKTTLLNICENALDKSGYTVKQGISDPHLLVCERVWKNKP